MHYSDKEQLEKNILEIVLYTHGDLTNKKNKTHFQITSIHNCKYFSTMLLFQMMKNTNKFFSKNEKTKNLKQEIFYLLKIKQTKWHEFEIISIKETTDTSAEKNKFLTLH